jgi:ABC-type multidrug transport system ATPase subunit
MSVSQFKEDVISKHLTMFNMEHTRNTIAGGVAGIRGVSDGERKRISIAEMMITMSSVACWDNTMGHIIGSPFSGEIKGEIKGGVLAA